MNPGTAPANEMLRMLSVGEVNVTASKRQNCPLGSPPQGAGGLTPFVALVWVSRTTPVPLGASHAVSVTGMEEESATYQYLRKRMPAPRLMGPTGVLK